MSYHKTVHPPRTTSSKTRRYRQRNTNHMILGAAVSSFVIGVLICVALLALFAVLLANTSLSLSFVRPLACTAAAIGVMVSSVWFSCKIAKRLLLCGFSCGLFYAGCQMCASLILYGTAALHNGSILLAAVLLLSGISGGALAAVRTVR